MANKICNGECSDCPYSIKWSKDMFECYATFIIYPYISWEVINGK